MSAVPHAAQSAPSGNAWQTLSAPARDYGMVPLGPEEAKQLVVDTSLVSVVDCRARGAALCRWRAPDSAGELVFVCLDPLDLEAHQGFEARLEEATPTRVTRALLDTETFGTLLTAAEGDIRALESLAVAAPAEAANDGPAPLSLSIAGIEASTSPVVRLVDSTLYDALRAGASDIHLEVHAQGLSIKYRLDGVLQKMKEVSGIGTAHQVISRLKVLSELDISERRIPQDGRFRVLLEAREIDFRVSVMPNLVGEDAVLRILDRKHLTGERGGLSLDSLGLDDGTKHFVRRASRLPYGLLLVTGPTGSGKTTTLYAALSEINTGLDKIITIEDPIEYQLQGVLQIPVNEKKGLTFARGLRSILRHDPDKIMVGEIRDNETAQISVQAALTGHQVFTTVHANNVFDVIGRFANMGVDSYSLVAALTGVMAQRLVRSVCPHCARKMAPSAAFQAEVRQRLPEVRELHPVEAVGCPACRGSGYRGRLALTETLPMQDELRDLLVQRAPVSSIKRAAAASGFQGLRYSALQLAAAGRTTLEEIDRVAPVEFA